MARLPIPGHDNGTWGDILNDYLSQSHSGDGTLKTGVVGRAQLRAGAVIASDVDGLGVTIAEQVSDTTSDVSKAVDSSVVRNSEFDFVVTKVSSLYVAQGRDTTFTGADPSVVVNLALASVPQRGASILFSLRGVHACSQTILVGNSTLLAGPAGRMATQIAGNGNDNIAGTTQTYAPLLVLDFSANDIDAIANATPGPSYRPHQWTIRDLGIKGGEHFRTNPSNNQRAGIKGRYNAGGQSGGRCGLVTLERVYVEGFYFGVDFRAAGTTDAWNGGVDTAHVIDCHTHRCVVGYRGGYSDTRFLYCDAWQAMVDPLAAMAPAGFVIYGRSDIVAFCEVEPSLASADGIRIEAGGSTDTGYGTTEHSRSGIVMGNAFCGNSMATGISVESGTRHRIVNNSMTDGLNFSAKSIWIKAGVTETEVRGNTVNVAPLDDSGDSTNLVLDNHVAGSFKRDIAIVEESNAPHLLTTGLESIPRMNVTAPASTGTGILRLTYCTARRNEQVTTATVYSSNTAASVTPTLARIGIYEVATNGTLTLVASTVNDTSLFAATSTKYTRTLSTPLNLKKGQRYAFGLLVVQPTGTLPTVSGSVMQALGEVGESPRITGFIGGQSDLPSSYSGALTDQGHMQYIVLR